MDEEKRVVDHEHVPASTNRKTSTFSRSWITGPVVGEHGDLPLLACCFVTGMVDSAVFSNYLVFVGVRLIKHEEITLTDNEYRCKQVTI